MTIMNSTNMKLAALMICSLTLTACDTDFDNPVGDSSSYSAGDADFSHFVALGDSLTAGYADSALYLHGQQNSYPAILAQQFALVGGGDFNQPLVSDNLGGLLFGGNPNPDFGNRLILNAATSSPEPIAGDPTTEVLSPLSGTFNNMGVPGAKSFHLGVAGYGNPAGLNAGLANPYFVRFASSATASMIGDAAAQMPSFFVMWVGNNDVLSYATSGGIGEDQTGNFDPATYGSNDITDPTAFAGVYSGLLAAMTANPAAQGVLINLPDVSSIPYFTTVPYNAIPLDAATATYLNTQSPYAAYNAGLDAVLAGGAIDADEHALRAISFVAGQNAIVIDVQEEVDNGDLTDLSGFGIPAIRHATAEDLFVLPSSSKLGTLADDNDPTSIWGVAVPMEDGDVLIPAEIQAIETARTAMNASIAAMAASNDNLILVDAAAIMDEISTTGINYGTGAVYADYATGGAFSLDGVHPTARGYAVVANIIIDAINDGFNANIPPVDPGEYSTIFVK